MSKVHLLVSYMRYNEYGGKFHLSQNSTPEDVQ